jgi:hypothetical protein
MRSLDRLAAETYFALWASAEHASLSLRDGEAWCPGQDSNLHTLRQRLLRPSCLPFHHPGKGSAHAGFQRLSPRFLSQA